MIKKSTLCTIPLMVYINKIVRDDIKILVVKKIRRAFRLKREFTIEPDASDVSLSKALEFYASAVMSERFLVEANDFLMEYAVNSTYVKPWAKELHAYWLLLQEQISNSSQLILAIIQEREKGEAQCKDTPPASG